MDASTDADDFDAHPDLRRVGADDRRKAFALLWSAARPDAGQIAWATGWLAVAGLLEALGPLFGKRFIDEYLLPRSLDWTAMGWLVAGYLVTGWAATLIRYFQLVRLAGLAMR